MGRAFVLGTLGIVLLSVILDTGCSGGGTSAPPPPPPKTLVSISVTSASSTIANGTTQQFTATGHYSDNSTQNLTNSVTWNSSNAAVATISNSAGSEGLATGVGIGAATITAASGSVTGSAALTVTATALISISIAPSSPSIAQGTTLQFTATGSYSDGSIQILTSSVTWSSSNLTVATISNSAGSQGLATALGTGQTTVTAALGSQTTRDILSVNPPVNAPSWTQDGPVARHSHSAVFDPVTGQMIIFGGLQTSTSAELNDLWLLSTGDDRHLRATSMTATSGPSARLGHVATYDSNSNRMTIFGGGSGLPLSCDNDVWILDSANGQGTPTWLGVSPSGTPPARIRHNGVYDPSSNSLIAFGGYDCGTGYFNDVWVLSNANGLGGTSSVWTQLAPSGTAPAARESSSAVYDPTSNVLTIYGGDAGGTPFGDVWILSHANGMGGTPLWTQLAPTGTTPVARSGHSAIYDSSNNRMTVFGGFNGAQTFGDTWVLTSANGLGTTPAWIQINATGTAPTLGFHSAVYDQQANSMYIFAGTSTTSKLETSNHTFVLSAANGLPAGTQNWMVSGPPVRYSQSAFYDSSNNGLFIFAGQHSTTDVNFNDYWRDSGVIGDSNLNWTNVVTSGTKPAERFGHTGLYDSGSNRMMVFGGALGFPAPCANDYWVLQHANTSGGTPTWSSITTSGTPPAGRTRHASVYDSTTNSLIIFGGFNCKSSYFNDVWVLSNANDVAGTPTWTQLTPTGTAPTPRQSSSAVYDPTTNSLIVFGGDAGGTPFGDLWVLSHANGSGGTPAWTQITAANRGPASRSGHSAIYDLANNRMTIYGGFDGSNVLADAWVLSGANGQATPSVWIPLSPSSAASPRRFHGAVYDPASDQMIIFAGMSSLSPLKPDANILSLTVANGLP